MPDLALLQLPLYRYTVVMNINDPDPERLDRASTGDGTAEAGEEFVKFLRQDIWPHVSPEHRAARVTKAEREEILGYGQGGV